MSDIKITPYELARYFDNTLLAANATAADFEALCKESREYHFKMVAVNQVNIPLCRELLAGSDVLAGSSVGFPLGQTTIKNKVTETAHSIEVGAQEIDYVINVGRLKMGDTKYLEEEMKGIVSVCRDAGIVCKAIFENCYLTKDEIKLMCDIALSVGPDFIKTSTGFGKGGATFEDVALMKQCVGDKIKVKAAGGVRTLDEALKYIELGVERIGTSRGAAIVDELRARL